MFFWVVIIFSMLQKKHDHNIYTYMHVDYKELRHKALHNKWCWSIALSMHWWSIIHMSFQNTVHWCTRIIVLSLALHVSAKKFMWNDPFYWAFQVSKKPVEGFTTFYIHGYNNTKTECFVSYCRETYPRQHFMCCTRLFR